MSDAARLLRSHRPGKPVSEPDPAYLPRGAEGHSPEARFARVGAERSAAAAQIQRSLRVWRKADEGAPEADEAEGEAKQEEDKAEETSENETEEKEEKEKEGEEKGTEQEGEPPKIAAKLEGVGLKIFRAAEGNQKDSGVVDKAQRMISAGEAKDMEDALNKLYAQSSGEERNKIKRTQKAFGFRHSRHS